MKLSVKWSIIGFLLPIIGVILGHFLIKKNEFIFRSIRRGSALSTILVVLIVPFVIYYFAFY